MKCQKCKTEIGPEDAFCGECGHRIHSKQKDKSDRTGKKPVYRYPFIPMLLTAGLIFVLFYIQSQLVSEGLYDNWGIFWNDGYLFVGLTDGAIAVITGIIVGVYCNVKSVKMSQRIFHRFSLFFLISMVSYLFANFLLIALGPWTVLDNAFSHIILAALFSIEASLVIVGLTSLSSHKKEQGNLNNESA